MLQCRYPSFVWCDQTYDPNCLVNCPYFCSHQGNAFDCSVPFRPCGECETCSASTPSGENVNGLDDDCSAGPGDEPAEPDDSSCATVGDPVHVGTGAFLTEPLTDVRLAGSAVPVEFTRVHNSRDGWPGPLLDPNTLGIGWSHTYNESLLDASTSRALTSSPPSWATARSVVHRMADGGGRQFICPAWSAVGWTCPANDGSFDVLTWDAGTTEYVVSQGDGLVTRFVGTVGVLNGRIRSHRNRAGDGWSAAYVPTTERLATVTDHLGRVLTFNWTAGAPWRITSLSVGGSAVATFGRDATGDFLLTASSVVGDDVYAYATTSYGPYSNLIRPFITSIVRGGRTITSVTYEFASLGGLGLGRVATLTGDDGSYSFRWPDDATNTCAASSAAQVIDRSTGGASCTPGASGDTYCASVLTGGVCDGTGGPGVCRASSCREFSPGSVAGSVRYNEVARIEGDCACGADEFHWDVVPTTTLRRMQWRLGRDGVRVTYGYDTSGRRISECSHDDDTNPATCPTTGEWHAYTYNATWGRLPATEVTRSRLSATNVTTTYTYDANALLTSVARQGYTYNSAGVVTLETQTTTYTRDAGGSPGYGRVTRIDGPATSERTDLVYWPAASGTSTGLIRYEREYFSASAYMTTEYSSHTALGYAQTVATPHSSTRTLTYAWSGQRILTMAEAGLTTTFTYDGNSDRVATVTEPSGRIVRFVYSATTPARLTDIDFLQTLADTGYDQISYTYDAAGRRLTTRLHRGATDVYMEDSTYDNHGLLASEGRGSLPNAVYTYDAAAMGYLDYVTRGDGDTLDPTNDTWGRGTGLTRSFGGGPTSTHTRAFLPVSPGSEAGASDPTLVTDPGSATRTYVWDDFGHIVSATSNDFGGTLRRWYVQNRLIQETRPDGRITNYQYDAAGRLTVINNDWANPSLLGPDYTFSYDDGTGAFPCPSTSPTACAYRRSRLQWVLLERTPGVFWQMDYDYAVTGEVSYERYPDARYGRYERDASGRVTRVVMPTSSNDSLRYTYDSAANNGMEPNEVASITHDRFAGSWGTHFAWTSAHTADAAGRLLSVMTVDTPAGLPHTFTYATHGRPLSMDIHRRATASTVSAVANRTFGYSNDGELTMIDSTVPTDPDRTFLYDGANRLTCATLGIGFVVCPTNASLVESYVFDGADNRTSARRPAGIYSYTLSGNAVDAIAPPGRTIDYVNAISTGGSRVSDTDTTGGVLSNARTYTYDGMGRLSGMSLWRPGPSSPTMQQHTIAIVYDHRSRPIFVSVLNNATSIESRYSYYYDLSDRLLGMINIPNVAAPTTYVSQAFSHVSPFLVGTLRTSYVSGVGTESIFYTANNENGLPIATYTTQRVSPWTTSVVWQNIYYPSGETLSTPLANVPAPPWRFLGQLELPMSDARVWVGAVNTFLRPALHLNSWRTYDPSVGLYLQPEPLALVGGENYESPFAYTAADPYNTTDPTGEEAEPVEAPHLSSERGDEVESSGSAGAARADADCATRRDEPPPWWDFWTPDVEPEMRCDWPSCRRAFDCSRCCYERGGGSYCVAACCDVYR